MDVGASFVGLRINGKIVTNRQAADYLNRLFDAGIASLGCIDADDAHFTSESEAKQNKLNLGAGEGRVGSTFNFYHGGLNHVIEPVTVTGYDEFFDDSKADEPADAYHFLCAIAAIGHEVRHAYQHTVLERSGSELGRLFFLNQWSVWGKPVLADKMYALDVNEIDAQHLSLKKLGLHVAGFKDFRLEEMERTDKGFVDHGVLPGYEHMNPVDAALCFYQDKRHEGMTHDFIEYPEGGYRSAKAIFRNFHKNFFKAVYARRTWAEQPDASGNVSYDVVDDYVANNDEDRLSRGFRANPAVFGEFKAEKDGFRQMLIMAMIPTIGVGDKSFQAALYGRIRNIFGVDIRPGTVCRSSVKEWGCQPCSELAERSRVGH